MPDEQLKPEQKMTKKDKRQEKSVGAKVIEEQKRKDARRSLVIKSALVAVVLLAVAGTIALAVASKSKVAALPGKEYPIVGREHIPVNSAKPKYNSNPPSSGPHYADPANWGIYTQTLPDEQVVHNLEHGGVWISYKDPNDKDLADKLTKLAQKLNTKIVLEPRPDDPAAISLVSWGWVENLDQFDENKITEFYNAHKNKGPEFVPDMGI